MSGLDQNLRRFSKGVLYAKWRLTDPDVDPRQWGWPRGLDVRGHLQATLDANSWLMDFSIFGKRLWVVMGLQKWITYEEFAKLCKLAVLIHDIGKVNDEFQEMMASLEVWYQKHLQEGQRQKLSDAGWLAKGREMYLTLNDSSDPSSPRYQQKFRHEIASFLWFLIDDRRLKWLYSAAGGRDNGRMVLAAALGHHRKTDRLYQQVEFHEARLHFPNGKIEGILNDLVQEFQLGAPPVPQIDTHGHPFKACYKLGKPRLQPERFDRIPETALSRALKYVTILSDVYGSMTPKGGLAGGHGKYRDALREAILQVLDVKGFTITTKQISEYIRGNLREFQKVAMNTFGDAIIISGCGGGKTTAGYLWAGNESFFCPGNLILTETMTGAAAQIFVDTGDEDRDTLRTSRADIDLQLMTEFKEAAWDLQKLMDARKTKEEHQREKLLRESALGSSHDEEDEDDVLQDLQDSFKRMLCPMTVATVDQLLGVITNRQASIMWLPYIINAKAILDEFDSFDRRMLGALEKFLEWFPGIPILGMSATVPKDLEALVKKHRPDLTVIESTGADDPAFAPRYRFHRITRDQADALFTEENRTLWVVNRVKICQGVGLTHPDALVYHAKFPYEKKRLRQAQFVEAFRAVGPDGLLLPVKAVGTSVIGSSIDIYGNRMLSEACHPADFLQRIGRASIRGEVPKEITDIYFYTPDSHLPYPVEEFGDYDEWLDKLLGQVWSYKELVDHYRDTWKGREAISLNLDIFETKPLRLREAASKTALLESDLPAIKAAFKNTRSAKERKLLVQRYEFNTYADKEKHPEFMHRIVLKGTFDERLGIVEG